MYKNLKAPEKWILKGIPALFIIGFFMHYIYDFSQKNILLGLISPVNESIWEHLKLIVFPLIAWWVVYYVFNKHKYSIDKNKWFTATLIALLTSLITIPLFYYFYTGAFGIHSLFLDILSLLIALIVGQLLGYHFYKFSKGINVVISITLMLLVVIIFMVFTIYPPALPIFKDNSSGQYGIAQGSELCNK